MAEPSPSSELETLARYIVTVHVASVVAIKSRSDLVNAPRHLCDQMRRQRRHLSGGPLATVQQHLTGNAFLAHPENIVLAMFGDGDHNVRSEAVFLITDARLHHQLGPVRKFKRPQVNLDADI